ncbi:MAG: hypothetical protein ACLP9L_30020 [Thermoguttaceae bacterium]
MKVEIHCLFESPGADDWASMESLARSLTDDLESVRVFAIDGRPGWLAVEFGMATQPQYQAVAAIDRNLRFYVGNRMDSTIGFPSLGGGTTTGQSQERPPPRETAEAGHGVGRRGLVMCLEETRDLLRSEGESYAHACVRGFADLDYGFDGSKKPLLTAWDAPLLGCRIRIDWFNGRAPRNPREPSARSYQPGKSPHYLEDDEWETALVCH